MYELLRHSVYTVGHALEECCEKVEQSTKFEVFVSLTSAASLRIIKCHHFEVVYSYPNALAPVLETEVSSQKTRTMGLADGETIRRNVYCRRFDTIQECNGPTDGRMEMPYEQVNITCCAE